MAVGLHDGWLYMSIHTHIYVCACVCVALDKQNLIFFTHALCLQIIKKHYPLSDRRKELMSFTFEFDTNSDEISMDLQAQVCTNKKLHCS